MLVSEEKFSLEESKKNTGSCENCEELLLVLLGTLELVLSFYTPKKKKFTLKCHFSFFFWFKYTTDNSLLLRHGYSRGGGGKNGSRERKIFLK